ncbi:hypothetical protein MRX96_047649 [Rhipicephalus microplus]
MANKAAIAHDLASPRLPTMPASDLAALLYTCRYACAVTSAHPNAAEKRPVLEITTIHSAPCDLPPYVSPQGDAAQAARGTSTASSMAYLSRLPTSPQFSGHGMAAATMVAKNPFCFFVQLAALLHTCRYVCAVTSAHPNAAEKRPVLEITTIHSAPCDLPPYVSPQWDVAQAARGTSTASSMAYLSRLPTSPQFSGHGMAAATMVAKNPFCFFVQLAVLLHTCRYACAVTSAHPNAAEKRPVLEITTIHSAPCDLPPYVSPQGDAAQAARGTSTASSMAYLSRLPTSPQFSGHGMAAATMVAKNPFCFFCSVGCTSPHVPLCLHRDFGAPKCC